MVQYVSYKKPIILFIGFLFFMMWAKAQELSHASLLLQQKDLGRAKECIDSFVLANAQNAEGWLLKATIYNAISKDANAKNLVPDSRMDAFAALQKAMQYNGAYTSNQLKAGNYSLPLELYKGYTSEGIIYFNTAAERNDKAGYAEALAKFKKAGALGKYIFGNGWGLAATDTSNLYYSAKAAINAGKEEEAFLFAKKIADAGVTGTGYESIYQWLAFYCKQQKNAEQLNKYAQLGIQLFPSSVYFNLILIDWQRGQNDYPKLFSNYDTVLQKQPGNATYQLAYLNDIYNYLYGSKQEYLYKEVYESKLSKGLLQFIKNNASNNGARLLLAKMYTNQANDLMKESTMRSSFDPKLIKEYKIRQSNLLLKANAQLKQLVNKEQAVANKAAYREARALLNSNNTILKLLKQ